MPERAIVMREKADERGFTSAVRTDDGGVIAGADGQGKTVEDATIVFDDGGVSEFEDRIGQTSSP